MVVSSILLYLAIKNNTHTHLLESESTCKENSFLTTTSIFLFYFSGKASSVRSSNLPMVTQHSRSTAGIDTEVFSCKVQLCLILPNSPHPPLAPLISTHQLPPKTKESIWSPVRVGYDIPIHHLEPPF